MSPVKRICRPLWQSTATILFLLLTMQAGLAAEKHVDNAIWSELLAKYVVEGVVDYAGFQQDEDKLDLVVLPESNREKPMPSQDLLRHVEEYLRGRMTILVRPRGG